MEENNKRLVKEVARLQKELRKSQKMITKLWMQHAKDRIDIRKVWKHGWAAGYTQRLEETNSVQSNSPLTPKMKLDDQVTEKLRILTSRSLTKQKRSIKDLLSEFNIAVTD